MDGLLPLVYVVVHIDEKVIHVLMDIQQIDGPLLHIIKDYRI